MLRCLANSFARLKSEIVDYHKGRLELESMDDVLPLQIYCVIQSRVENLSSYHGMMQDYLRQVHGLNLERKLLCHFHCAIMYVCNDWIH